MTIDTSVAATFIDESFRPVSFMPMLRLGDSVQTAISYHQRLYSEHAKESRAKIRGSSGRISGGIRRVECREVARRLYGDEDYARRVLHENTLFGVLSRGMSVAAQKRASDAQVLRSHERRIDPLLRSLWSHVSPLELRDLRSCENCIRSDLEERGFPSWRVLHQIACVDRCVYHGTRLRVEVEATGRAKRIVNFADLPSEDLNTEFKLDHRLLIPTTSGYSRFLKAWVQTFEGGLPQIAIDNWMEQIFEARDKVGVKKNWLDSLERR